MNLFMNAHGLAGDPDVRVDLFQHLEDVVVSGRRGAALCRQLRFPACGFSAGRRPLSTASSPLAASSPPGHSPPRWTSSPPPADFSTGVSRSWAPSGGAGVLSLSLCER